MALPNDRRRSVRQQPATSAFADDQRLTTSDCRQCLKSALNRNSLRLVYGARCTPPWITYGSWPNCWLNGNGAQSLHTHLLRDNYRPPWTRLLRVPSEWCAYGQRPHLSSRSRTDWLLAWNACRNFRVSPYGVRDRADGVLGVYGCIRALSFWGATNFSGTTRLPFPLDTSRARFIIPQSFHAKARDGGLYEPVAAL